MITRVDERLRREAERYSFRFGCEACMAYDPDRRACAHAYPNGDHLDVDLSKVEKVVFCKEFEVG
ncbi:MAG: hypothetical protein HY898_25530 [Deltaproteobacteria bacterium]|nr:hypothetical protein [Deltaproteobacteria bacterium]